MSSKYTNFVSSTSVLPKKSSDRKLLSGEEAAKLYLEEISTKDNSDCECYSKNSSTVANNRILDINNTNLFLSVQNNDIDTLKHVLDSHPDKVNTIDEFGWSLLMIACQANSVEVVQGLLRKGADTSVRDKAGNSAQSLVIKNKNYILADLLLNHRQKADNSKNSKEVRVKLKDVFNCDICNKTFPDKEQHLSSTLHNISASKVKKRRPNYAIPQSNKGFQIMLKSGWDKDGGLGPGGLGNQYPIKTVLKIDRKGLGHKKRKTEDLNHDAVKHKNRKILNNSYHKNRKLEIMFRREFY